MKFIIAKAAASDSDRDASAAVFHIKTEMEKRKCKIISRAQSIGERKTFKLFSETFVHKISQPPLSPLFLFTRAHFTSPLIVVDFTRTFAAMSEHGKKNVFAKS
jgi:hypothetical protein